MDRARRQPQNLSPTRAAISGISLLMLVALAMQASAGMMTPAMQARQATGLPVVRYIAQVVTRRADRPVKRQEVRPALVVAHKTADAVRARISPADSGCEGVQSRRLLVLLTNLPPPAIA